MERAWLLGIDVVAPTAALVPGPTSARVRGPDVHLALVAPEQVAAGWPAADERVLLDTARPDGTRFLRVRTAPGAGWLVEAPGVGHHHISASGHDVRSSPPPGAPGRWLELLLAQVLPTAATALGHDCLHASAVALGGRAWALLGPSGTGKSSVAAHLLDRGAELVCDDVLALSVGAGGLRAAPGPALLRLAHHEHAALGPAARSRLGPPRAHDEKLVLAPHVVAERLPVGGLIVLERVPAGAALELRRTTLAPADLLAAAFLPHLADAGVLLGHLAVAERLAATEHLHVRVPPSAGAAQVADALAEALGPSA